MYSTGAYNRKANSPIKKWAEELNSRFSKEDTEVANEHMKRCLTSLIIRQMQIKTTMRYHLITVKMSTIKDKRANASEIVVKRQTLSTLLPRM